jgi:hypothetical protein
MTEYIVHTESGRNISYIAESKAEAERFAQLKGNQVKTVYTIDEYERERDLMLLQWRYEHEKAIEERVAV